MIKIIKLDLKNLLRNPTLVFSISLLPIILILVMGTVTRSKFGSSSVTSFDFYGLSMLIFSIALIAMVASNTFLEERVIKGNKRIIYAPVSNMSIYISKIVSTFILGAISYSLMLLVGQVVFKLNYGGIRIWYILILMLVLAFFSCSLGIMACCIFKSEEKANAFLQIPIAIFLFFSGVFFGIHRAGSVIKAISNISPIKWVYECCVKVIYDNDFSTFFPTVLILLVLSGILILICGLAFKSEDFS